MDFRIFIMEFYTVFFGKLFRLNAFHQLAHFSEKLSTDGITKAMTTMAFR